MARTRNEHYEYVERDGLFRKRVKDATGKYVAIYGETVVSRFFRTLVCKLWHE